MVPLLLGPEELLLHAGALLPGDPRPIEGLLGLSWTRGQDSVALECCERLLALPSISADPCRAGNGCTWKEPCPPAAGPAGSRRAALRQAPLDAPNSLAAVRGLRQLLLALRSAPDGEARRWPEPTKRLLEAQDLLQRELLLSQPTSPGASPAVESADRLAPAELYRTWRGCGCLAKKRRRASGFCRAGLQGLARGFVRLSELLAQAEDWLAAADFAGRAACCLRVAATSQVAVSCCLSLLNTRCAPTTSCGPASIWSQALSLGGEEAGEAEARLLSLDGGHDPERRRRSLERRLQQAGPGVERIELQHRLLLLCCEQFDRDAMVSHAVVLLRDAPGMALRCALWRKMPSSGSDGRCGGAQALLDVLPVGYPRIGRLLAWLADQHERRGPMKGRHRLRTAALPWASAATTSRRLKTRWKGWLGWLKSAGIWLPPCASCGAACPICPPGLIDRPLDAAAAAVRSGVGAWRRGRGPLAALGDPQRTAAAAQRIGQVT